VVSIVTKSSRSPIPGGKESRSRLVKQISTIKIGIVD